MCHKNIHVDDLAYRHILKINVKELDEKIAKITFFKT